MNKKSLILLILYNIVVLFIDFEFQIFDGDLNIEPSIYIIPSLVFLILTFILKKDKIHNNDKLIKILNITNISFITLYVFCFIRYIMYLNQSHLLNSPYINISIFNLVFQKLISIGYINLFLPLYSFIYILFIIWLVSLKKKKVK